MSTLKIPSEMDVAPCYKLLVYNVYTVYTVACMPVNCWGKLENYWNGLIWVSSDSEQKVEWMDWMDVPLKLL